jgi:hypothetical protein
MFSQSEENPVRTESRFLDATPPLNDIVDGVHQRRKAFLGCSIERRG